MNEPAPPHMAALATANRVRSARAVLKRDIHSGAVTVAEVLARVPWEAETMTCGALIGAQHRWGVQRTRRICRMAGVADAKPVGALTLRQRRAIAVLLEPEHESPHDAPPERGPVAPDPADYLQRPL